MNYYNPYYMYPYLESGMNLARPSIFSRLAGGLNLKSILSGTQKTLNFANQALPLIKQVEPMVHNAKTMFKVMNEFKKVETPSVKKTNNDSNISKSNVNKEIIEPQNIDSYGPTFFL